MVAVATTNRRRLAFFRGRRVWGAGRCSRAHSIEPVRKARLVDGARAMLFRRSVAGDFNAIRRLEAWLAGAGDMRIFTRTSRTGTTIFSLSRGGHKQESYARRRAPFLTGCSLTVAGDLNATVCLRSCVVATDG